MATAATGPGSPQPSIVRPADATGVENPTASQEDRFVPLSPCRIADTRVGNHRLAAYATRPFYVAGTFGFAPQGGKAGGCGVPIGATSVALSVTSTNSGGDGYLAGWATGTNPAATNFASMIGGHNVTSNPILPIGSQSTQQLQIKAGVRPTDVVMDVTGYYVPQIHALFYTGSGAYIYSGSSRVKAIAYVSPGVVNVTLDRDVSLCSVTTTGYYTGVYASAAPAAGHADQVQVRTWSLDSTTHRETPSQTFVVFNVSC
jgi:hypothetical protein